MRKRENKQNHRPILRRFTTWLHGAGAKCALIYAVGTLVLLVLFAAACAPQRYSLSVGAISHQTITATKDVEDTVTTESRRREASVRVEATYHFQEGVTESVLSDLDETFRQLRIVQQYGLTLRVQTAKPRRKQTSRRPSARRKSTTPSSRWKPCRSRAIRRLSSCAPARRISTPWWRRCASRWKAR